MSNFAAENAIPDNFNEIDANDESGSILRTLVDFVITREDGNYVAIDELGGSFGYRGKVIARGTLVEPMNPNLRQQFLNLVCTSRQEAPVSHDDFAIAVPQQRKKQDIKFSETATGINIVRELDRNALQIGDVVDGYCIKTFRWYEAKIINTCKDVKGDRLKIHFKGWNAKFDEWIDRSSERLTPQGASTTLMYEAAKKASDMVPWFESEELLDKASQQLDTDLRKVTSIKVQIDNIEDWCIDYTYANPTLWIIAASGIWYRVAGVLCPGGHRGQPNMEYSSFFAPMVNKYICAAHVAMVLLDFLPAFPKLSLATVVDEVAIRSHDEVSEIDILRNYQLLLEQLGGLEPPLDWDKSLSIAKCPFMSQLKKQGEIFVRSKGKAGFTGSHRPMDFTATAVTTSSNAATAATTEPEPDESTLDDDALASGLKRKGLPVLPRMTKEARKQFFADRRAVEAEAKAAARQQAKEEAEAERLRRALEMKIKYPIEDSDHWHMEYVRGNPPLPQPQPSARSRQLLIPAPLTSALLQVWATLMNFRGLLKIPYIPVESLEAMLLTGDSMLLPAVDSSSTCKEPTHSSLNHTSALLAVGLQSLLLDPSCSSPSSSSAPVSGHARLTVTVLDEEHRSLLLPGGLSGEGRGSSDVGGCGRAIESADGHVSPVELLPSAIGGNTHPLVREIFIRLMSLLLDDKLGAGKAQTRLTVHATIDSLLPCAGDEDSQNWVNCFVTSLALDSTPTSTSPVNTVPVAGGDGGGRGGRSGAGSDAAIGDVWDEEEDEVRTGSRPWDLTTVQSFLRTGDAWQEMLRICIAEENRVVLAEFFDPIAECELILETLLKDPDSAPFSVPIDPDRDGAPDYWIVIREPIDLGTILQRIRSGWYDEDPRLSGAALCAVTGSTEHRFNVVTSRKNSLSSKSSSASSASTAADGGAAASVSERGRKRGGKATAKGAAASPGPRSQAPSRFSEGDLVDFFNAVAGRWYEAEVTTVDDETGCITIRYLRWGAGYTDTVEFESNKIAAFRQFSINKECSWKPPEEVNAEPQWGSPVRVSGSAISSSSTNTSNRNYLGATKSNKAKKVDTMKKRGSDPVSVVGKNGGHDAIAQDVRQVWANCRTYLGQDSSSEAMHDGHPLVEASDSLAAIFETLYASRVTSLSSSISRSSTVSNTGTATLTSSALSRSYRSFRIGAGAGGALPVKARGGLGLGVDTVAVVEDDVTLGLGDDMRQLPGEAITGKRVQSSTEVDNIAASKVSAVVSAEVEAWTRPEESWETLLVALAEARFMDLSLDMKLRLLLWCCDKLMTSSRCRAYLEEVAEQRNRLTKEEKSKKTVLGKSGVEKRELSGDDNLSDAGDIGNQPHAPSVTSSTAGSSKKRSRGSESGGSAIDRVVKEGERKSGRKKELDEALVLPIDRVHEHAEENPVLAYGTTLRQTPIGLDRSHREYWVFEDLGKPYMPPASSLAASHFHFEALQVFCFDPKACKWTIYSDREDLEILFSWLSEKGMRENALRKTFLERLVAHGLAEPEMVAVTAKSSKRLPSFPLPLNTNGSNDYKSTEDVGNEEEDDDGRDDDDAFDFDFDDNDFGSYEPSEKRSKMSHESSSTDGHMKEEEENEDKSSAPLRLRLSLSSSPVSAASKAGNIEGKGPLNVDADARQSGSQHVEPDLSPPYRDWCEDYCSSWVTMESPHSIAVMIDVLLTGTYQLGTGLKVVEGKIMVTSFRTDSPSAGKDSGLRVGDIILTAHGRHVVDIPGLQKAIQAVVAGEESGGERSNGGSSVGDKKIEYKGGVGEGSAVDARSSKDNMDSVVAEKPSTRRSSRAPVPSITANSAKAVVSESAVGGADSSIASNGINCSDPAVKRLSVLVLRKYSPQAVLGFKEATAKDKQAGFAVAAQERDDTEALVQFKLSNLRMMAESSLIGNASAATGAHTALTSPAISAYRHPICERGQGPSRLVGTLLDLLTRSAHPYAVPDEWDTTRSQWVLELHKQLLDIEVASSNCYAAADAMQKRVVALTEENVVAISRKKASQSSSNYKSQILATALIKSRERLSQLHQRLHATIVTCLLDFEAVLFEAGNILSQSWLTARRCCKWRQCCARSASFAQLASYTAILDEAIVWKRLTHARTSISTTEWLACAPKNIITQLPPLNSPVLYYGDGHAAAVSLDKEVRNPAMWGASCPPLEGHVIQCVVTAVRILLCGSPTQCHPFAQLDLRVTSPTLDALSTTYLPAASCTRGRLYRVLNRVVNVLLRRPYAAPFLEAVDPADHPDYFDVIKYPVDLSILKIKAYEDHYDSVEAFIHDVTLLRDNCHTYCAEAYPALAAAADRIRDEALTLLGVFKSEIDGEVKSVVSDTEGDKEKPSPGALEDNLRSISAAVAAARLSMGQFTGVEAATDNTLILRGSALKGIPVEKGSVPAKGDSFTICVRLGGNRLCPYLLSSPWAMPAAVYQDARIRLREKSSTPLVLAERTGDLPATLFSTASTSSSSSAAAAAAAAKWKLSGFRYGTVIGQREARPGGFLPWEWLKVEWADGSEEGVDVNAWDIEVVLTGSMSGMDSTRSTSEKMISDQQRQTTKSEELRSRMPTKR